MWLVLRLSQLQRRRCGSRGLSTSTILPPAMNYPAFVSMFLPRFAANVLAGGVLYVSATSRAAEKSKDEEAIRLHKAFVSGICDEIETIETKVSAEQITTVAIINAFTMQAAKLYLPELFKDRQSFADGTAVVGAKFAERVRGDVQISETHATIREDPCVTVARELMQSFQRIHLISSKLTLWELDAFYSVPSVRVLVDQLTPSHMCLVGSVMPMLVHLESSFGVCSVDFYVDIADSICRRQQGRLGYSPTREDLEVAYKRVAAEGQALFQGANSKPHAQEAGEIQTNSNGERTMEMLRVLLPGESDSDVRVERPGPGEPDEERANLSHNKDVIIMD